MQELETEVSIFQTRLEEWRKTHLGKFVLIKGNDVIGFYDSLESAFSEGSKHFGLEPFLVQQITPKDAVNVSFMGKRLRRAG